MTRSTWWVAAALAVAACENGAASKADGGRSDPDAAEQADVGQPRPDAAVAPADAGVPAGPDAAQAGSDAAAPCTPTIDAGTSRTGYPLDGWEWTRHGVLFEPPAGADGDLAPSVVADGATVHLFFTRKTGLQHRIHHAVSADEGATWTVSAAPGSGLGTDDVIAYPAVLFEGGRFRLWYGSGTFDLAESTDGEAWTVVQSPVLRPGDTGAFDDWSLLYPGVAHDETGYHLFYTGYDGQVFAVGRADSSDGIAFTKVGTGPLLARGAANEVDNHAVAQSAVVRSGRQWLVWYGAYDTSKTNPGPYRVALATSTDGLAFEKRGLTLEIAEAGVEAWSTRDPAVLRTASGWLMVYAGMGDDGRYRLMRATSATCAPADP